MTIGKFYKQTWWLWAIFLAVLAVMGHYITGMFYFMIPLTIGYSIYFGIVRVAEINRLDADAKKRESK